MGEKVQVAAKKPEVKRENLASKSRNADQSQSMSSPVDQVLYLQRTIGNQAVQKLARSGALQAKLRIGQPRDKYVQEADRVADAVMRMSEPQVQRQAEPEEEEEEEELIQTKALSEQITPLVQRQEGEEEEEEIQTKPLPNQTSEVVSDMETSINSIRGGGQPLPGSTRAFFEPRFGQDFSQVRLHTDTRAAESARAVNAQAYTIENNIVFGDGQYNPKTNSGKSLLAHELTHVVQQTDPQISGLRKMSTTGSTQPELQVSSLPNARIQRMQYDTSAYRIRALTIPGNEDSRQELLGLIRERLRGVYASRVTISGTTPNSTEEMRVMNGLIQYLGAQSSGQTIDHTDTESDLLIPDPGQDPIRVTVQTNSTGEVTATVHANRPLTQLTTPFIDHQAAITAIQNDFSMTVSDTPVSWTLEQLNQVILALRQLSTGERNQLTGIQLVRESQPSISSHPRATGEFATNIGTTSGRRDLPATITLYDRAFESNERLFFGSGQTAFPASFGAIMHEIGHAIEQQPRASALVRQNIATDERNVANRLYQQSLPARDNAMGAMNTAIDGLIDARSRYSGTVTAQQRQAHQQFLARISDLIRILSRINNNSDSQNLRVLTRDLGLLPNEVEERNQAAVALRSLSPRYPFMQEAEQLIQVQDTYIEASRTSAGLFQAYRRLRSTLQERERETAVLSEENRSRRLASFERMLHRAPRQAAPTSYDTSIEEIFAESFMLYRSDPEFLRTHRLRIFEWFEQGHHLQ